MTLIKSIFVYISRIFILTSVFAIFNPAFSAEPTQTPKPQQGTNSSPSTANMLVLLNVQNAKQDGITVTKSIDGKLVVNLTSNRKISVGGLAMLNEIQQTNGNTNGVRANYYQGIDPNLLNSMWMQAAKIISSLGIDAEKLEWQPLHPAIFVNTYGGLSVSLNTATPFAVHPRADLPLLKQFIDRGELVLIGEVDALAVLNQLNANKQRQAETIRKRKERTAEVLAKITSYGNSLVSLIVTPQQKTDNTEAAPNRFCTIKSEGDMFEWTAGFRYLERVSKAVNVSRTSNYDDLAKDLNDLYGQVHTGKCQIVVLSNDDASKLANAFQREKLDFNVFFVIEKNELSSSYALSQGYTSLEQLQLSKQLVAGKTIPARQIEKLGTLGVKSLLDFNSAIDRMVKEAYSSERSVEQLISFLTDDAEGKPLKLSALKVKEKREIKEATERKSQEEANRARQLAFLKEYPFYAVVSCGMPDHINILACFNSGSTPTDLKLTNGNDVNLYQAYNLSGAGVEKRDGFYINLKSHFKITAQNASDTLILTVKIYSRETNKVLFTDKASMFGVIRASN